MRKFFLLTLLVLGVALLLSAPTQAFRIGGLAWPHGRITYYIAATGDAAAINLAARAWNDSGAHVKFVRVGSRSGAGVVVMSQGAKCIGTGWGTLGWGSLQDQVMLYGNHCNTEAYAQLTVHEFGHVLGLNHELHKCAAMNPSYVVESGSVRGGDRCHHTEPLWEWHCGLLERDDVLGAVSRYGGSVRLHGDGFCPIYKAGAPTTGMQVTFTPPASGNPAVATVTLVRPAPAPVPKFLVPVSPWAQGVRILSGTSCPPPPASATSSFQPQDEWTVPVGGSQQFTVPWPTTPGSYCFSAWALDVMGRPSAAETAWVTVPPIP